MTLRAMIVSLACLVRVRVAYCVPPSGDPAPRSRPQEHPVLPHQGREGGAGSGRTLQQADRAAL